MLKKKRERIILHTSNIKEGERKNYIIHYSYVFRILKKEKERIILYTSYISNIKEGERKNY